ncbi:exported protein [Penaeus vannamei]|uniref:Exported protein n=1 Tax=Penaeus vannamei TaxID=6689 RepID=A0A3R7QWV2_PENVA|nr:exported protein [Penaeus vannamei]
MAASALLTSSLSPTSSKGMDVLLAPDVERHEDVLGAEFEIRHDLELGDGGPDVFHEARHQDLGAGLVPLRELDRHPVPLGDMTDCRSARARRRPESSPSAPLGEFFITAVPLRYLELYGGHGFFGCAQRPLDHQGPFRLLTVVGAELNPKLLLDLGGVASAFSYGDAYVFGKDVHREDHALLEHVLLDELLQLLDGPVHIGGQARYDDGRFPVLGNVNPDAVLFPDVTVLLAVIGKKEGHSTLLLLAVMGKKEGQMTLLLLAVMGKEGRSFEPSIAGCDGEEGRSNDPSIAGYDGEGGSNEPSIAGCNGEEGRSNETSIAGYDGEEGRSNDPSIAGCDGEEGRLNNPSITGCDGKKEGQMTLLLLVVMGKKEGHSTLLLLAVMGKKEGHSTLLLLAVMGKKEGQMGWGRKVK